MTRTHARDTLDVAIPDDQGTLMASDLVNLIGAFDRLYNIITLLRPERLQELIDYCQSITTKDAITGAGSVHIDEHTLEGLFGLIEYEDRLHVRHASMSPPLRLTLSGSAQVIGELRVWFQSGSPQMQQLAIKGNGLLNDRIHIANHLLANTTIGVAPRGTGEGPGEVDGLGNLPFSPVIEELLISAFSNSLDEILIYMRLAESRTSLTGGRESTTAGTGQPKVLVVDDDSDLLECLLDHLNEEGYAAEGAVSAKKARHHLARNNFDAAIFDVNLPDGNGLALLEELRARDQDLSVIILTGNTSTDAAVKALRGRACDYLEKPVTLDVLDETLEKALERRRA